jgi:glucokinase
MSDARHAVISIDLGGTKLAAAVFGETGRPISKSATLLGDRSGEAVGRLVIDEIRRLRDDAAADAFTILGVGISVPGIAHEPSGRVWAPNIAGWDDYPLHEEVTAAVLDVAIPVRVCSDRAACILGEVWQGAARGCRDAIFVAVGTGIGSGILADGRVLHGAHGSAGAIGWMALDRPFKPDYQHWGCYESHASGDGLARVLKSKLAENADYMGRLRSPENATAAALFAAYEENDPLAVEVLGEAIEFWGMAAANLVSLFNPEKIIFGGGVFGPATRFLEDIANEARRWAQPVAMQQVALEPSQLAGDAALYGAAFSVLRAADSAPP